MTCSCSSSCRAKFWFDSILTSFSVPVKVVQFSTTKMVKIKISWCKCFTMPALAFLCFLYFAAALAAALRWLCAGVYMEYFLFPLPQRDGSFYRFIERAFQPSHYTSNCTWKTLAASITCQLQLYRVHLVYNFLSSRARCLPMDAERGLADSTQQLLSLCFFYISNRTLLWISNFSTNNKSYMRKCSRAQNARMSDAFSNARIQFKHTIHHHKSVLYNTRSWFSYMLFNVIKNQRTKIH